MNEITLYEYKEYKGVNSPNNDLKLEPIVEFVNSFIQKYCCISFNPVVVTNARVECDNGYEIMLPHSSVSSVEALNINGTVTQDFVLDGEIGVIENTSSKSWPSGRNIITVDYTYGLTAIPYDLKIAGYELISYFNKGNFSSTRTSSTGESVTNPNPVLIPPQIKLMLDMYKTL